MVSARLGLIAVLFAACVFGVAGCGDNDSSSPTRTGAGTTSATEGATGNAGASGTTGSRPKRRKDAKQKSGAERETGGSAVSPTPPASPTQPQEPVAKDEVLTPEQRKLVRREMKKQAREICRGLQLEALAKQYKVKSKDPDAVARAYAAVYLPEIRSAVAAGCKQGLLEAEG